MPIESTTQAVSDRHDYLFLPDGFRLRFGIWDVRGAARAGTVVLLGGRSEFLEKYGETISRLNERGFKVFSFDWRGQGLSDRLLPDAQKGYIDSYATYLNDMELFLERVVYPQSVGGIALMAHSMGAHIALRFLEDFSHKIDKSILVSPMADIRTDPIPSGLARRICRIMARWGMAAQGVIGSGRHNPFNARFSTNRLTSDPRRFAGTLAMVAANPCLSVGCVTYGWLRATYASIDIIQQKGFGEKTDIPVLFVLAGDDRVVKNEASKRLSVGLKHHHLVEIEGARHEILNESDALQSRFWRAFDDFMLTRSPTERFVERKKDVCA